MEIATNIERIITNFKKDSAARKTSEYLKTRLDTLNNLWSEFSSNNALLELEEDRKNDYFKKGVFKRIKQIFPEGLQLISNTKPYQVTVDESSGGAEGSNADTKVST
ncbi:unnamed protein product [Diatraea saccharalis]|uniref:Uncharacterized protein n=1 Tax=Diatraea saccharalis TaxID=40085 RepID=A0A9N9WGX4_9NEOP|nr:unnamed protein product [Diatraea saccharalis]